MPTLPQRANVVVIGAGVVGASIAAHLVERGEHDVVLLDSHAAGSGSSSKPIGGIRAQFFDETNIAMSLRAVETFTRFEERFGVDIALDLCGYLMLITDPKDIAVWQRATDLHASYGMEATMLDASEVARRNPYIDSTTVLAGQFGLPAGTALPERILAGYLTKAIAGGARLFEHTRVTGIESSGEDALVATANGSILAPTVVVAAGAWSAEIGAMTDVPLPVTPVRRQMAFHRPAEARPHHIPFTIDVATSAYVHNLGSDTLAVGRSDPAQEPGFHRDYDDSWVAGFRATMGPLSPLISALDLHWGWAGLYEMTPDGNGLVGEAAGLSHRVLYAAGFSGHGVMHSPVTGELVADLYFGTTPFVDISGLDAARFAPGAPAPQGEGTVL